MHWSFRLYRLYYIVTVVGVVAHEIAHKKFALSRNLEVTDVNYFSIPDGSGSVGHVTHSPPQSYKDIFIVGVAPLIFNTIIGCGLLAGASAVIKYDPSILTDIRLVPCVIAWWVGISLLLHAIPSSVDIDNIKNVRSILWQRINDSTMVNSIEQLQDVHLVVSVILLPIKLLLDGIVIIIFCFKHPLIIFTYPFILFTSLLIAARKYGVDLIYTALFAGFAGLYLSDVLISIYEDSVVKYILASV